MENILFIFRNDGKYSYICVVKQIRTESEIK